MPIPFVFSSVNPAPFFVAVFSGSILWRDTPDQAESLEADKRTTSQRLADAEAAASELQRRLERSEPIVEDLKAKV